VLVTYYGEAVQWECDELGHLNMRHYMTKVHQARQFFFIHLGLVEAFHMGSPSTVRTTKFMVRYLKESRPGDRLKIETGLLALHDSSAELVHIMSHFDGTPAAVIVETVEHIYLPTQKGFSWPKRVQDKVADFLTQTPAIAMPRGLPNDEPIAPSLGTLKDGAALQIGAGVFQPSEIDVFGAVTPQSLLGRVTESVGNFKDLWPEVHEARANNTTMSAALLEIQCHCHRTPESGSAFVLYSAALSANAYTRLAAHHIVDPVSGDSFASMLASGCLFDLATRKLVKTPEDQIKRLNAIAQPDLRA